MAKTKIDWCDMVYNCVWGCKRNCPYCYACKFAKRLCKDTARIETNYRLEGKISKKMLSEYENGDSYSIDKKWIALYLKLKDDLYNFKPTFLHSHYAQPLPKNPQRIFLDSMSDVCYWKKEWYDLILKKICNNMQHTFIILTKNPYIFREYIFPHNVILGVSVTTQNYYNVWLDFFSQHLEIKNKIVFSIEPIEEKISLLSTKYIDWLIVGPETGNRKNKPVLSENILQPFFNTSIPVFMKEKCDGLTNKKLRQEFPEV